MPSLKTREKGRGVSSVNEKKGRGWREGGRVSGKRVGNGYFEVWSIL